MKLKTSNHCKEQGGPMAFYHNLTEDLTEREKKKNHDKKSKEEIKNLFLLLCFNQH